jgi:DNA-binding NtrC family response regulator
LGLRDRKATILIIDDDVTFCRAVTEFFRSRMFDTFSAHTGREGLEVCARNRIDVVLLDQKLPDGEGNTLCESILEQNEQSKIIFITGYPSYDNALKAIRAGAFDYLSKPVELQELDHAVERSLRTTDLEKVEQLERYRDGKVIEDTVLVGKSDAFEELSELIKLASSSDSPVLITGETGTGKNLVAKAIHYGGTPQSAFVSINCAALPENLIEAELFGHEKGAFTGAEASRRGVFEMAEGGSLFLDEIGDMPFHLQSKLLSVLDEKRMRRLGGETYRPVDVRVIAATNADITEEIRGKKFREDLYYRLNVIRLHIPPLRERREDIPELCDYLSGKLDPGRTVEIPDSEISKLQEYDWPGNVRELRNILERTVLLRGSVMPSELLGDPLDDRTRPEQRNTPAEGRLMTLDEVEKDSIRYALDKLSNNYARTARTLGISFSTLKRKIKKYGLA